jgi:hypothetical protein
MPELQHGTGETLTYLFAAGAWGGFFTPEKMAEGYLWLRFSAEDVRLAFRDKAVAAPLGGGRELRYMAGPALPPPGYFLVEQDPLHAQLPEVKGTCTDPEVDLLIEALRLEPWAQEAVQAMCARVPLREGGWAHIEQRAFAGCLLFQWATCCGQPESVGGVPRPERAGVKGTEVACVRLSRDTGSCLFNSCLEAFQAFPGSGGLAGSGGACWA